MTVDTVPPETRFVSLDGDRIAYQVFGDGEVDLICVAAIGECLDLNWDWPPYAAFLRRLAQRARVIIFDVRGSGSSDSPSGDALPSWEQWADEAKAVLDEVGSERAVVLGTADGGPTAVLFAASHPTRARGLILVNSAACFPEIINASGVSQKEAAEVVEDAWGTEALADYIAPDAARDPAYRRWFARSLRLSLNPREAKNLLRVISTMDVRSALESVRVPTLVLHRESYQAIPLSHGRYLAERIPGASLVVLPGRDSVIYTEPAEEGVTAIEKFLMELHAPREPDRALAAILFTDIVSSTEQLSTLGDREWRNLLDSHDVLARTVVEQNGGRLVHASEAMGDGILATFDGPGRAIRCAKALNDSLRPLGVSIRAGLHTGEVEVRDPGIAGIGVHIAARVLGLAEAGEILVSAAVPMLVAGSGFEFEDRGEHELKGVPGSWRLFAVVGF
jgi:class 3 adenylate cyclase